MRSIHRDGWNAHCNSDLSGMVIISKGGGPEVEVPGDLLICLVAQYVTSCRVAKEEQEHPHEVLKIERRVLY